MSGKDYKLSEQDIIELFQKYEINKGKTVDTNELSKLVRDLYINNHNIKDIKDLNENDERIIKISVEELLKNKNLNKPTPLQIGELLSDNQNETIINSPGINFVRFYYLISLFLLIKKIQIFFNHIGNLDDRFNFMRYTLSYGFLSSRVNDLMISGKPIVLIDELGQAVKTFISRPSLYFLYGSSIAYILYDTLNKAYSAKNQGIGKIFVHGIDSAIWHSLASLALPTLTAYSVVNVSGRFLKYVKFSDPRFTLLAPTFLGFLSIPLISKYIDHATDVTMNNTLRKFYSGKMPEVSRKNL